MSYNEKKAFGGLGTMLLVIVGYCIYAFGSYNNKNIENDNIKFWAGAVLFFILIGVIITVITQIVIYVGEYLILSKEKNQSKKSIKNKMKTISCTDEMDRLIELKTAKISYAFTGIGFVAAMIAVVLGSSIAVMINILFFSMCFGGFCEGVAIIYYYKVGVSHE